MASQKNGNFLVTGSPLKKKLLVQQELSACFIW
jgi:hypothetical protein